MKRIRAYLKKRAPVYSDVLELLALYFRNYGGVRSVVRSPYAHVAIIIAVITFPIWTSPAWWDLPLSILPNLIGFTLSGYAVMMTLGNEKLRIELTRPVSGRPSAFMAINATFFHFLLLQIMSMLIAIIAKSRPFSSLFGSSATSYGYFELRRLLTLICWAVGYTLFIYALTSALAATSAIFRVGRWLEWSTSPGDRSGPNS